MLVHWRNCSAWRRPTKTTRAMRQAQPLRSHRAVTVRRQGGAGSRYFATEDKLAAEKTKLADAAARAEGKLAAEKAKLAQVASKAQDKLSAEKTKLINIASKARVIARPKLRRPLQIKSSIAADFGKACRMAASGRWLRRPPSPWPPSPAKRRYEIASADPEATVRSRRSQPGATIALRRKAFSPTQSPGRRIGGSPGRCWRRGRCNTVDGDRPASCPRRRRRNDHCGEAHQRPAHLERSSRSRKRRRRRCLPTPRG